MNLDVGKLRTPYSKQNTNDVGTFLKRQRQSLFSPLDNEKMGVRKF
jgi:hypothetical protein